MDQETLTFKYLIESKALTSNRWKQYFPSLVQKGISSISTLLDTDEETLAGFHDIPEAPLNKIKKCRQDLIEMRLKITDTFSIPLGKNDLFIQYQFIPQLNVQQYLKDWHLSDESNQINKAKKKANDVMKDNDEFAGLTKQQGMLIALYCQEPPSDRSKAFYSLFNKYLRERNENIVLYQPTLFLVDSAIRNLPSLPPDTITWRGVNYAPNLEKFYVGNTVCFTGVCSTTLDKEATLFFMEIEPQSGEHKRTLFKLNMINGKSISQWSQFEKESEVIPDLCSRWKVLKVIVNHEEYFNPSIPSYHCDYYIELQQIEGETLFSVPVLENRLSGISLLLKVEVQSISGSKNFKEEFIEFFILLNDDNAKTLLIKCLQGYWDEDNQQFFDGTSSDVVKDKVLNFFMGLTTLNDSFIKRDVETENAFRICEQNEIYSWIELQELQARKRSLEDLQNLGFSEPDSRKLFYETEEDRKLHELYESLNCSGDFDNPHVELDLFSKKQLKHYIKREGAAISLYRITQSILDGAQLVAKRDITSSLFRLPGRYGFVLQRSDVYITTAVMMIQMSLNAFQLWYGDITVRQFTKMSLTGLITLGCGVLGTVIGTILCPVAGIPAILAALIGGAVAGGAANAVTQWVLNKLFPDGEEEDMNTKRKIYYQALASLKSLPSDTMPEIRKHYHELAVENHPDKRGGDPEATVRFQGIAAAYENIQQYHEVLKNACEDLGLDKETLTLDRIKEWKKVNQATLFTGIKKVDETTLKIRKSYKIVYRHLAYSNQKSFKWLRNFLNAVKTKNFHGQRSSKKLPIEHNNQP